MMIDTGCENTAIDSDLRPLGGEAKDKVEAYAFGKSFFTERFSLPPISMGKWKLPSLLGSAFNFGPIRTISGVALRGCLGADAFQQCALDVDFDKRRIRFVNPQKRDSIHYGGKDGLRKPMQLPLTGAVDVAVPIIDSSIDEVPLSFMIDTGNNDTIGLSHESFQKLVRKGTITATAPPPSSTTETVAGSVNLRAGRFTRGHLLGLDLKGWAVSDTGNMTVVGLNFLINFNFTVDFPNRTFYFARRSGETPRFFFYTMGLLFRFDQGRCIVTFVDKASPAQSADIRVDDEIIKLGSLPRSALNFAIIFELGDTHAGRTIDVELVHAGDTKAVKTKLKLRGTPTNQN
jgi:hypothetical protein